MNRVQLKDCRSFFLDSGVVIDLLKTDHTNSTPEMVRRCEITQMLMDSISDPKVFGNDKKTFQMSAISIAEIFHVDGQSDTLEAITSLIYDSNELEVYAFDEATALFHNQTFHDLLGKKEIDKIKKAVNYPVSLYSNIRDRIRKDIMIATTAKLYGADIILTNDSGFKSLCDYLDIYSYLLTDSVEKMTLSVDGKIIYSLE